MSARPLHVTLAGAVFLSSQQLLQFQRLPKKLRRMFKSCTNSAREYEEVLMKFFVWNLLQP